MTITSLFDTPVASPAVARSSLREVRNPVLGLEDAKKALATLDAVQAEALYLVLTAIGKDATARSEESWRKHKGPMAAYWKACGVYSRHIAKAIRAITRARLEAEKNSSKLLAA